MHSRLNVGWGMGTAMETTGITLHTERLLLRDFVEGDWVAVQRYRSDPRYRRYYPSEGCSEDDAREFVGRMMGLCREEPRYRFQLAIERLGAGDLMGNVGIRLTAPGSHKADMGIELDPAHWGRGYAEEAGRRMLRFAFETLGVHRVWADCLADNAAAARTLERLGLRQEGRLRHHERFKGRYWDGLVYGILRQEWVASRPNDD